MRNWLIKLINRWKLRVSAFLVAVVLIPIYKYDAQLAILLVLFLTLLAIVWYTHETQLLRLQHFRPYVLLVRVSDTNYRLHNAGNGAALNVRIVDVGTNTGSEFDWAFVPYLGAGADSSEFATESSALQQDPATAAVLRGATGDLLEASVVFEDVEGNFYKTRMLFRYVGNNVLSSVKWSRRYGRSESAR